MGSNFAPKSTESMSQFPAGVLTGSQVSDVWAHAKKHQYALPAVNVIGSNSINAVMETAKAADSPVIIQFSNGGAKFNAGKSLSMDAQQSAVLGAIAGAENVLLRVAQIIEAYRTDPKRPNLFAVKHITATDDAFDPGLLAAPR